jgi:hypothetical protein
VQINDYTAELQPVMTPQGLAIQVAWDPRSELKLAYDDKTSNWTAEEFKQFDKGTESYTEFKLADDEELNREKLDALKTALDDLAIVDVDRKPAGLSDNLKAGVDFLDNAEARKDLRSLGFAAVPSRTGDGQEIISSEGEVLCTTKDGVEYVLRFGDLRMDTSGKTAEAADADAPKKPEDQNVQRYLFVMARFNEDAVPKPELEDLPPLPEGVEADEVDAAEVDTVTESEPAVEDAADSPTQDAIEEEEEEEEAPESAETDTTSDEASPLQPAGEPAEDADTPKNPELERILAERKRIEQENQRKLDEYNAQIEKGRQTVKDLNLRFGDWYFVVSNDTFQKIRLGRNDVVKKKAAEGEPASAGGESAPAASGFTLPGLPSIPGTQTE